jgi:hypothetical protein
MDSSRQPVKPPAPKELALREPVFPLYPEKLNDPGPVNPPQKRFLIFVHAFCPGIFIPLLRIYLSSTNAISIAGIARILRSTAGGWNYFLLRNPDVQHRLL